MASDKELNKATQKLRRLQSEQKEKAKKLDKARLKLEKRRQSMASLEAKIARLGHRASELQRENGGGPLLSGKNLRTVPLIYKPHPANNGNGDKSLERVIDILRIHGIHADVCVKTSGKVARRCARQAAEKNEPLIIVAAGDGTIEDVASQLVGTNTALGIIPLGTMNNVARSLGVPLGLDDACELLGAGITRQIDIGRVGEGGKPEVEYFLETAGMGLTGIAFPAGQAAEKRRWGKLPGAISKLFDLEPGPVEVQLDDREVIRAHSQLVTVSNAPLTGPSFLIAPEAKMDDGLLDVAVYDGMGKTEIMAFFMQTRNGKSPENPKVRYYCASHVVIRSSQKMPVVSDKDPMPDQRIVDIKLIPQGLRAVVGNGIGLSLPVQAVPSALSIGAGQAKAADAQPREEK